MFDDEMLTIDEVASYLKLKPQTIYRWAQNGKIPGAKFGKEWRFRRSAIESWIDEHIEEQSDKSRRAQDANSGAGRLEEVDAKRELSDKREVGPEKN